MKINLKEYFEEQERQQALLNQPGPVITISRDYGCRANEIAQLLVEKIKSKGRNAAKPRPWRILNKEFLKQAAEELQLEPYKVEHALNPHQRSLLEDFVASYSPDYLDDKKIQKSIRHLVNSYGQKGNLIIVGRAGVAVTRNMSNSLHIKLEAPLLWRAEYLKKSQGITMEEALARVHKIDQRRRLFISQMRKEPYEEALFDVIFNRATLSTQAIGNSILQLLTTNGMI